MVKKVCVRLVCKHLQTAVHCAKLHKCQLVLVKAYFSYTLVVYLNYQY